MRLIPILLSVVSVLPLLPLTGKAQATAGTRPMPSDFDSKGRIPKSATLPAKMDIPPNTRIEVSTGATVNPSQPVDKTNMSLLWNPHLLSAVIESDQQNVHAVFQWEGGRSSEAFIINGFCFRLTCLAYPQVVAITGTGLDFWVSRQNPEEGASGTFPCVSWYTPATFAGTASLNGSTVLVFTPGEKTPPPVDDKTPSVTTYPKGASFCLDPKTLVPVWLNDGQVIYTFTYTPVPNIQINPQGFYLKAIQNRFGHWP